MMLEVIAIAGPATIAAGIVYAASRIAQPAIGAHKIIVRRGRAVPFADQADRTDPDGAKYIGALMEDPDDRLWEQRAGELATGTGQFPMLPDDEIEPTGVQALAAYGIAENTTEEHVEALFAKHAPKPEMLP